MRCLRKSIWVAASASLQPVCISLRSLHDAKLPGTGYDTPEKFRDEVSIARSQLSCGAAERLPIGIGFLAWQLEKSPVRAREMITIALDNKVQAIWLAFGQDLSQHIHFIRDYETKLKRDWRVLIFIQTSSPEEASIAATEWKVDVIVAQG